MKIGINLVKKVLLKRIKRYLKGYGLVSQLL